MASFISNTLNAARHRWQGILSQLGITVPAHHKHGACPYCGGKDRFRFDDQQGRGTWICNRCGAGDGLSLVALVNGCTPAQAAHQVAACLPLIVLPATAPSSAHKGRPHLPIVQRVDELLAQCIRGPAPYLQAKGLEDFSDRFAVLVHGSVTCGNVKFPPGTLVAPLQDSAGQITGAQLIDPQGCKRMLTGSQLKGSYVALRHDEALQPERIIVTEGVATGLAVATFTTGSVFVALSATNLRAVALVLRHKYPDTPIVIAGDQDCEPSQPLNPGRHHAQNAALAVHGFVTLPPTEYKADWDDYRRQVGNVQAKADFEAGLYSPPDPDGPDKLAKETADTCNSRFHTTLPIRCGSEGYDARQDYIIKGLLPCNALASIYGPSGSYKSFLAIDWACRVASGLSWATRKVAQGAVIYVVGEGGIGVARRIRAWEQACYQGQRLTSLFRIDCPVFPASPESLKEVLEAIAHIQRRCAQPIRLIVLDTLARCFGGSDENAARDMGAFIQGCDILKARTGAAVLIIHHSGKDQDKGARGSSAFRAALDVEFHVRREHDRHALVLSCTKMKDAQEPPRQAYDLRPVALYDDEDGEPVSSLVVVDTPGPIQESGMALFSELRGIPYLTDNHLALWQCIHQYTQQSGQCSKAQLRDAMRARGFDVDKKFSRWLDKLAGTGLFHIEGEQIVLLAQAHDH